MLIPLDVMPNLMVPVLISRSVRPPQDLVVLVHCVRTKLGHSAVFVPLGQLVIHIQVSAQQIRHNLHVIMTVSPMRNVWNQDSVSVPHLYSLTLKKVGSARTLVRGSCVESMQTVHQLTPQDRIHRRPHSGLS